MTIDDRLTRLEHLAGFGDGEEGPTRILVCRVPGEIPGEAMDAYIAAHPECVSKVVQLGKTFDEAHGPR